MERFPTKRKGAVPTTSSEPPNASHRIGNHPKGGPRCREPWKAKPDSEEKKAKRDACYYKVKARYDVWPSAYASGALAKCRKVGAKNWGNKSKD
jgi:hypothetical protein